MDLTPEDQIKLRKLIASADDLLIIKDDKKAYERVAGKIKGHAIWVVSIIALFTLLWDKFKVAIDAAVK